MGSLRQHSQPLTVFGLALALLVAGDWQLRRALAGLRAPAAGEVLATLGQGAGLLGLALIAAALLLWALLLARWQLSFFYPLWGVASVLGALLRWLWFDGWMAPPALLGIAMVCAGAALLMRGGHSA